MSIIFFICSKNSSLSGHKVYNYDYNTNKTTGTAILQVVIKRPNVDANENMKSHFDKQK